MKPKVLFTASTYAHIRNFHLPYLAELQRRGCETHVACADAPEPPPGVDRTVAVPFRKSMRSPDNFRAALSLRRLAREEAYALVVCHTSLAAFFTRLALKGMKNRPKTVNMVHGYLFDGATPFAKKQLLLNAERLTAPETDLLLTMNGWDYRAAKAYRLGRRVENVPGVGVDFSRLDAAGPEDGAALRARYGIDPGAFVLVYAAEFSERKSQRVVIEAMRLLTENMVLVLPGQGARLDACRALAERLELGGRVLFPGQSADMPAWYRAANAAVSASRSEGLPFNVMEAMHCSLPVAASAVKGHVDLIEDGVTGLLYPYGDAAACASRLLRLTEMPGLGLAARRSVERYGLPAVKETVMARYLSLLPALPAEEIPVAKPTGGVYNKIM